MRLSLSFSLSLYLSPSWFCLSEGLPETTKDFAGLMVTSEFAEGDLKSAVICRLHYGLKREYNVVVECDPPSANVFWMPIGIERRISVNAGNGMRREIPLRKPVIQLQNGCSMHVKGNARTFAFMLLWGNKARGSIMLDLVGDKGPDTALGGSSSQFTRAVHQKLVRNSLLYIWLLSFDELRLAMNAHLPVVRPLLCYARRGATPMHQKIRNS